MQQPLRHRSGSLSKTGWARLRKLVGARVKSSCWQYAYYTVPVPATSQVVPGSTWAVFCPSIILKQYFVNILVHGTRYWYYFHFRLANTSTVSDLGSTYRYLVPKVYSVISIVLML